MLGADLKKKLFKIARSYTRMLRAVLNKSWRQHPTRHQLYGHLPPITKTIQVRRTRHAGHCWKSKDELISDVLPWTPTYGRAKAGRPARTYIQQLCEDTGCNPEDLPEAMNDREKCRERVRDIRADGTTWWWWWSLCSFYLAFSPGVSLESTWCSHTVVPTQLQLGRMSILFHQRIPNECAGYDTKQSDGDVPVMLELWGMRNISSLLYLPGPLWPWVVAPDKVLSMCHIELNCVLMPNWIAWNRTVFTFKLHTYAELNCFCI